MMKRPERIDEIFEISDKYVIITSIADRSDQLLYYVTDGDSELLSFARAFVPQNQLEQIRNGLERKKWGQLPDEIKHRITSHHDPKRADPHFRINQKTSA